MGGNTQERRGEERRKEKRGVMITASRCCRRWCWLLTIRQVTVLTKADSVGESQNEGDTVGSRRRREKRGRHNAVIYDGEN